MTQKTSRTKKILSFIVILISLLIIIPLLFWKAKAPDYDKKITAPFLNKNVEVRRDSQGVPHIYARTEKDAWFAYGYTLAQDRLFQMEVQRRLARGELAEIFGEALLHYDRLFRTWMFRRTAAQYLKQSDRIDPRALSILDAWLAGINHFIKEDNLPVEFSLLGIKPRPFTRVDSLSIMAYMGYSFADGVATDSIATLMEKKHGPEKARLLFPGYRLEKPVSIMETQAFFDPRHAGVSSHSSAGLKKMTETTAFAPPAKNLRRWVAAAGGSFAGSNSWLIAPSRSKSGGAILANDPHVSLSNPAVWYEAHIKYVDYENYGYHAPLFPFPMMAHNKHKGWGITMFENDDLDLFYETIDPKRPGMVKYRGRWEKMKIYKEVIKVKGGKEVALTIRVTPHGPIISEFLPGLEKRPVSLWWVYHHEFNNILTFAFRAATATNLKEATAAAAMLAAPGLNLSYADNKGNIAWWAAGRIPIRPAHVDHKRIMDGASGRDEPRGYLPFAQNPQLVNPPSGIIVTANNKSTVRPLGPVKDLEGYWCPTDRAARITDLLKSRKKWSIDELKQVQTDFTSASAKKNRDALLKLYEGNKKSLTETGRQALDVLKKWNLVTSADSAGAAIYNVLLYHLFKNAVIDEITKKHFIQYCDTSDYWNALKGLLADFSSPLWDNLNTKVKETSADIALLAMADTLAELNKKPGGDPASWQWGSLHHIEYRHPMGEVKPLNLVFNIGPLPAPGEAHIINRLKSNFGKHDYRVVSVPSHRRLIDFSNLETSVSIIPSGNSGNPASPHYDDQVKRYLAGKYRPINFTRRQVEADTKHVMILKAE